MIQSLHRDVEVNQKEILDVCLYHDIVEEYVKFIEKLGPNMLMEGVEFLKEKFFETP